MSFSYDDNNIYVFQRKYLHVFKIRLNDRDYDGVVVCKLNQTTGFILCVGLVIEYYLYGTRRSQKLHVTGSFDESEQIISSAISHDDRRFAAGVGKVQHGADRTLTCIVFYELKKQYKKGYTQPVRRNKMIQM